MKKTQLRLLLIIGLFIAVGASFCKKSTTESPILYSEATVVNTGDVALDGCGWLIEIDSTKIYNATNLSDDFKQNGLKVVIDYRLLTSKFQCSTNPNNLLQQILLTNISKK